MKVKIGKEEACKRCADYYCCRGLCQEMNDYLVKKLNKEKEENTNKK